MHKLKFIEQAKEDVREAYLWYEEKRIGLGEDFLLNLSVASHQIQRRPKLHKIVFRNKRRLIIPRFPYAVVFEIDDDVVYVLAVIHASRHPKRWKER